MLSKKICTYRPYYIDTNLLFDMYSTLMDGLSLEQDIVEKHHIATERTRKSELTTSFTLANFASFGHNRHNGNDVNEANEVEIRQTYSISPCLLLNWVLDRLVCENRLPKVPNSIIPMSNLFTPSALNIGKPFILEGSILYCNSLGINQTGDHNTTRRNLFDSIRFHIMSPTKKQQAGLHVPYCMIIDPNSFQDFTLFSDVNVCIKDFFSYMDILTDRLEGIKTDDNKETIEKLDQAILDLNKMLNTLLIRISIGFSASIIPEHLSDISKKIHSIGEFTLLLSPTKNIDYANDLPLDEFRLKLVSLNHAIYECREEILGNIPHAIRLGQQRCVFDLKDSMFYNASISDIVSPMQVKCLAILRNYGRTYIEAEIIAVYQ